MKIVTHLSKMNGGGDAKDIGNANADFARPPDETNLSVADLKGLDKLMDLIIADNIEALKELAK